MKLKIYCCNCYFDNFIISLSKNEKKEELISCSQRWFLFFFFFSHVIWRLKIQMSISYFMSEKIQKKFREFRNFKFDLLTGCFLLKIKQKMSDLFQFCVIIVVSVFSIFQ